MRAVKRRKTVTVLPTPLSPRGCTALAMRAIRPDPDGPRIMHTSAVRLGSFEWRAPADHYTGSANPARELV